MEIFKPKLEKYLSLKEFTYFRPPDWQRDNMKLGALTEEQLKLMK